MRFVEEIMDEINRYKRDQKLNLQEYKILNPKTLEFETKKSKKIKTGDIIKIENQRVPADLIILSSK